MFTHKQVWAAIDALAQKNDMSVSRLARSAGLDPTTFNKSKRTSSDGRERWPSTESLAKIMAATSTSTDDFWRPSSDDKRRFAERLSEFDDLAAETPEAYKLPQAVPLLGLAEAGSGGFFDDGGFPQGQGWDEVHFPRPDGENVYALEISGDSMEPLYREGDRIVVSPTEQVRRGDRVVVKTQEGEVMAKILHRQSARQIELHSVNPAYEPRIFDIVDIEWMARIIWASQ